MVNWVGVCLACWVEVAVGGVIVGEGACVRVALLDVCLAGERSGELVWRMAGWFARLRA